MTITHLEQFIREHANKKGFDYLESTEKKLLDTAFALPIQAISFIATPIISFLIKHLEHQHPLHAQQRYSGKHGLITINKFQTLVHEAHKIEPDRPIANLSDERITPTGRLIRAFELDELPQLPLVFAHKLDLLGVRTLLPKDVDLVAASDEVHGAVWKDNYLDKLPRCGLITPHSLRDPERKSAHGRNIPYDLDYMENASLGLDLYFYLFEVGPFIAKTIIKGTSSLINYYLNISSAGKNSTS